MKRVCSLERRTQRTGYLFTAPLILGMLLFVLLPVAQSLNFSFNTLRITAEGYRLDWTGIENYYRIFAVDPDFRLMLFRSVRDMIINVPVVILFSFFLASLLNQRFRGRGVVRAILFLPVIIASGVVENIDQSDQLSGIISAGTQMGASSSVGEQFSEGLILYLQQLNISPQITDFIISTIGRVYDITIMSAVPIIIFLSGLQSISPSLFEASYIEGASKWEVFWKISLPMVSPLILVSSIYCVIDSFTNVSNPMISRIHSVAFDSFDFGTSSAMAWSYTGIILVMLLAVYRLISRHVFYNS